ncbi:hypothetical protein D046_6763B, partial [Vibrio parahaemolyticus V-223/04]
DRLE